MVVSGGVGINGDCNINSGLNCIKINNVSSHNIRGYTSKSSGVVSYSYYLSSDQTTYTTSSTNLYIPGGCFSISILYIYYTTGASSYQGATPYYAIKYSSGSWIFNGGTIANTQGAFQFQPLFSVLGGAWIITHTAPVNNGDVVNISYKIDMI